MRLVMRWLRSLLAGRRLDREMREEMRQHIELATERFMARGMSEEDARTAALREFGNVHYLQEESRDARGGRFLEALTPDARLAVRMLFKSPLLSVVGGLGMAVAMAIATGLFTFMTFYYSDAPVEDGHEVVTVEYIDGDEARSTDFDFEIWKRELESIEDLAAYRSERRDLESLAGGSGPVEVAAMTASAFRVPRVPPILGRPILASDEVEGAPAVVVIGHREWQQRFSADPGVIGSQVRLDGVGHAIVGVMPENFRMPLNHGFWTALGSDASPTSPAEGTPLHVFGRLAPGVAAAAAEAELASIGQRMVAAYPQVYERLQPAVRPYIRHVLDVQWMPAWIVWLIQLFGGLILVGVAVNVAVLFFARTALRGAEITVRTALGASRSRIVTQLFLEALALASLAAAFGWAIAELGFRQLTLIDDFQDALPYWLLDGLPTATVLYAAVLALLAAVVVGILPGLQATGKPLESTLRELGGGTGLRLGRTWTALICIQVAVAVGVLPSVVALAWNYVPRPSATFPTSDILTIRLEAPAPEAATTVRGQPSQATAYGDAQAELLRRVEEMPEVAGVTFGSSLVWMTTPSVLIEVDDPDAPPPSELPSSRSYRVDRDYLQVIGATLLAGRTFTGSDLADSTTVVVNQAFANRVLGGGSALGRRFREVRSGQLTTGPWVEVVGVVADLRQNSRGRPPAPEMFHPIPLGAQPRYIAARTNGLGTASIAPRVREIAAQVAPELEVRLNPLDAYYYRDATEWRTLLLSVGLATLSVLLLSAAGISAMMSFAVTHRQREVGIRTALGASRRKVIASIFERSARQLGLGLVVGVMVAALVDGLSGGELLDGEAVPLVVLVASCMLLSGGLATLGPARRALRIQPMEALREE